MTWHETKDWGKVEKVHKPEKSGGLRRATMEEWESWLGRAHRDMDDDELAILFQSQTGLRPPIQIKTTKWTTKPADPNLTWETEVITCPHCGKKHTKFDKYRDSDDSPAAA